MIQSGPISKLTQGARRGAMGVLFFVNDRRDLSMITDHPADKGIRLSFELWQEVFNYAARNRFNGADPDALRRDISEMVR